MVDVLSDLKMPTERHERFLRRVAAYCRKKRIGLGLRGSTACGAAGRFSDLDLALSAGAGADDLRFIAEGIETPVMGFFTVNPKGILTVSYPRGFCVEIGIRKTFALEEGPRLRLLLSDGFTTGPTALLVDVASLYRPEFIIPGDGPRLLYKAALKFLCGKCDAAAALLRELSLGRIAAKAAFAAEWKTMCDAVLGESSIPPEAVKEFDWMYRYIRGNWL